MTHGGRPHWGSFGRAKAAHDYLKRVREDFRRSKRRAVERGVHLGATPFGFRREHEYIDPSTGRHVRKGRLITDEKTAPLVLRAFELRAEGTPWTAVAEYLEKASGKRFTLRTVRNMLTNEVYCGVAYVNVNRKGRDGKMDEPIRNEDAHEAIVPRSLFNAVQGARQLSKRPPGGREGRWAKESLLLGLPHCQAIPWLHDGTWNVRRRRLWPQDPLPPTHDRRGHSRRSTRQNGG